MNAHYAHLLFNHLPIAGLLFGVAIFLLGLLRRADSYERIGLGLLVASALLAIPVLLTGEGAEEVVEHLPGFTQADHRLVHEHEEAGEQAFWILQVMGAAALVALWAKGPWQPVYRWLRWVVLLLSVGAFVSVRHAAQHGGEIRRPELREGATAPAESESAEEKSDDAH